MYGMKPKKKMVGSKGRMPKSPSGMTKAKKKAAGKMDKMMSPRNKAKMKNMFGKMKKK